MSGVEAPLAIAGAVLGAFPILISTLEHYRRCAEVCNFAFAFDKAYKDSKREIGMLEIRYEQLLTKLFWQYVKSEEELNQLLDDPKAERWLEVEQKLREWLPQASSQVYLHTMQQLKSTLEKIKGGLALTNSEMQAKIDNGLMDARTMWLTTKYSFSADSRHRLFKKVGSLLDDLERIRSSYDETTVARNRIKSLPKTAALANLIDFWQHANIIYASMLRLWQCSCRSKHCTDLLLQHRDSPEIRMKFMLHYDQGSMWQDNPWIMCGLEVSKVQQRGSANTVPIHPPVQNSVPRHRTLLPVKSAVRKLYGRRKTQSVNT